MKITKNTVVTVNYELSDAQGNVIEEGSEPMVYLHGGYENTLSKIEAALEGKQIDDEIDLQLEPADAFGDYDAALVKVEPRSRFPGALEVGMQFEGILDKDEAEEAEEQEEEQLIFTVTDIAGDKVVLDANHPFAGISLRFHLHVAEIRAATAEEITHEHVHDSYGLHEDDDEGTDEYRSHSIH